MTQISSLITEISNLSTDLINFCSDLHHRNKVTPPLHTPTLSYIQQLIDFFIWHSLSETIDQDSDVIKAV